MVHCIKCGVEWNGWGLVCNVCQASENISNSNQRSAPLIPSSGGDAYGSGGPSDIAMAWQFTFWATIVIGILLIFFPNWGITLFIKYVFYILFIWAAIVAGGVWGILTMLF